MLTPLCKVYQAGAKTRATFVFLGVYFGQCHTSSVSLNLFVFHTRPTAHNLSNQIKKIPKDSALGRGSAPFFSLGWLPAECNKGLCYAALLQISLVKAQWEGAPKCEMHGAENASSVTQINY